LKEIVSSELSLDRKCVLQHEYVKFEGEHLGGRGFQLTASHDLEFVFSFVSCFEFLVSSVSL